ncbi:MAG TPA: Gfo/Idh/MocA family oxidoreductase, partial [Thermotogota bacterium]|nr:Gfo/Idh/MocA family oxidoreductase [Thermotogota bacterium]
LRNHQFDYSTSDYKRLLSDPTIDLIIIATQHDSHAQLATESLDAGKHVYVEKPLAITEEQLESVKVAYERNQQHLFVGFNRRFSPFARFIKENMQTDKHPCIIQYTVNAGYIPKKNWIQSPEKGGGGSLGKYVILWIYLDILQNRHQLTNPFSPLTLYRYSIRVQIT